ncbi:MAG: hypothetical protein AAF393_04390 [Pseudomonadota bacterium]
MKTTISKLLAVLLLAAPQMVQAQDLSSCDDIVARVQSGTDRAKEVYRCLNNLSTKIEMLESARQTPQAVESKVTFVRPKLLATGWSQYAGYDHFTYAKDSNGLVYLNGLMSGCPNIKGAIFSLPDGFRPATRLTFSQLGSESQVARVDVTKDGQVIYVYHPMHGLRPTEGNNCSSLSPNLKWLTLSGIVFPAAD